MLLSYVMQNEREEASEQQTNRFRDELFIAAYGTDHPDLFERLYPEIFGADEEEIEWIRPEDPDELQDMMEELRSTGWRG